MNKFAMFASLIASVALGTSAHATQYIVNGDFTSLTNGVGQLNYNTTATGWSTTGYNFVFNQADVGAPSQFGQVALWDAANGGSSTWNGKAPVSGNYLAMDGDYGTAAVTQTVTGLTVGKVYDFSLNYAFAQQFGYTGTTNQTLTVTFGGNSVTSPVYTLPSEGFSGWSTYSGTLTATSTSEVLSILAYGDVPVPPFALLTGASLTAAVPEPATWGMMIVGLGAMGAFARRRRQVLATA